MNANPLWRRIKRYVETGRETPKVDLKQTLDLSTKQGKVEFVKDVTAIANTPGGDGFLILGVVDAKERHLGTLEEYIAGFQAPKNPDILHRQMVDALTQFCNRVPTIEYDEILHPGSRRHIGVVTIKRSSKRPHSFIKSSGDTEQHDVYIRRGTATYRATPEEIIEMSQAEARQSAIVINLSTHPLTDDQRVQIQQEVYIQELIEVPVQFDAAVDLYPQIEKILETVGLTVEEWSSELIFLLLPGIAPGAAALLAYVHGLRGGFPKVLWIYQDSHDRSRYIVAQSINLQELRDRAREQRVQARQSRG